MTVNSLRIVSERATTEQRQLLLSGEVTGQQGYGPHVAMIVVTDTAL